MRMTLRKTLIKPRIRQDPDRGRGLCISLIESSQIGIRRGSDLVRGAERESLTQAAGKHDRLSRKCDRLGWFAAGELDLARAGELGEPPADGVVEGEFTVLGEQQDADGGELLGDRADGVVHLRSRRERRGKAGLSEGGGVDHLAVLHAAEVLWREGLRFDLRFIGGSGWGAEFPRRAADLAAAGRPVEVLKSVSDQDLDEALATAAFTVFPSLHEGYGLPVVESLTHGTPAISSDFGATAEIAADGGVLTIDPRDDQALQVAMRRLLTDPAALSGLREQIGRRPDRRWSDYADQLWSELVAPVLLVSEDPADPTSGAGTSGKAAHVRD